MKRWWRRVRIVLALLLGVLAYAWTAAALYDRVTLILLRRVVHRTVGPTLGNLDPDCDCWNQASR